MAKMKINQIEEYFKDSGASALKKNELFDGEESQIDIKTELSEQKIVLINTLHENDIFLESKGLKPLFKSYYEKHMRLLISKDRKSRGEFVEVEKGKREENNEIMNRLTQGLGR